MAATDIEIVETELPRHGLGRRIKLEATVNGTTLWRVWYEDLHYTLEDKRRQVRRDVEAFLETSRVPGL